MAHLAPPPVPPRITTSEDERPRRHFRTRMLQVTATLATLLLTAWCCTLGAFPAVLALVVAKHVLVAILIMGLGVDEPHEP
jgi:hypothetical protein